MKNENKYLLKAFLWDQFIRPFYAFLNINALIFIFLIILAYSILILKSKLLFIISLLIILVAIILDTIKYYKSGEFMYNYRKYKYPGYRNYIKNKPKGLNTLNNLNSNEKVIQAPRSELKDISRVSKEEAKTDDSSENKSFR
ncbi:MAG: hypothetical protein AABY22_01055 [Nanoarchaeota archaeon]